MLPESERVNVPGAIWRCCGTDKLANLAGFDKDDMTAMLAILSPACFLKRFDDLFTG